MSSLTSPFAAKSSAENIAEPPRVKVLREPAVSAAASPANDFYDQQIQALVQQLFFQASATPVRHIGIASVEPDTETAQLCLDVGLALAALGPHDVGLVDVRLHLEQGERLALFGASGAGKSTVLSCLAGIENPDVGRIHFGDTVFFAPTLPLYQRPLAYLTQSDSLFPHLSVRDNIAFALRVRGGLHDQADAAIRQRQEPRFGHRGTLAVRVRSDGHRRSHTRAGDPRYDLRTHSPHGNVLDLPNQSADCGRRLDPEEATRRRVGKRQPQLRRIVRVLQLPNRDAAADTA